MPDDWKGEHLIRGVKLTPAERHATNTSTSVRIGKRTGRWRTPEKTKRSHGAFMVSAFLAMKKTT